MASCAGLRLDPGHDREGIRRILGELLRRSGLEDTLVYFACTRGVAVPGTRDPTRSTNGFFATVTPLILRGQPDEMRRGLHATLATGIARIPAAAVNPAWKNSHWGDFVRATFAAKDSGHDVPILLSTDGAVAEAPGFNVVALVDGTLVSPDRGVLEGISCRTMLEIARDLGLPARYGRLMPEELLAAEEVFLTATSCGLFPVTRIDGRQVGAGVPGPVTTRLLNTYYERKNAGWHVTPAASIPAPEGIIA
jgi:branched-chain amino acid aminotransferase